MEKAKEMLCNNLFQTMGRWEQEADTPAERAGPYEELVQRPSPQSESLALGVCAG